MSDGAPSQQCEAASNDEDYFDAFKHANVAAVDPDTKRWTRGIPKRKVINNLLYKDLIEVQRNVHVFSDEDKKEVNPFAGRLNEAISDRPSCLRSRRPASCLSL